MEWTRETRLKLAGRIQELSHKIQEEEFAKPGNFPEKVDKTIERITETLDPLGFERANKDWKHEGSSFYGDSPTHLWFETAQGRIVRISKEDAEKVLILGFP